MARSDLPPLRSLPRLFLPGADPEAGPIDIPREAYDKLHKVLRLGTGDEIAVLPNDGRLLRCRIDGRSAVVTQVYSPETEAHRRVILAQALPKGDKLDDVVRMATELGVAGFALFPSERSVVRWDQRKMDDRMRRLATIAREACEVSFRTRLPTFEALGSLNEVLTRWPESIVLSEVEGVGSHLRERVSGDAATLVIGPEGGWAPREVGLIGARAATLGPRVFRVDTACAAACALAILTAP